jgi:hypothetical protein
MYVTKVSDKGRVKQLGKKTATKQQEGVKLQHLTVTLPLNHRELVFTYPDVEEAITTSMLLPLLLLLLCVCVCVSVCLFCFFLLVCLCFLLYMFLCYHSDSLSLSLELWCVICQFSSPYLNDRYLFTFVRSVFSPTVNCSHLLTTSLACSLLSFVSLSVLSSSPSSCHW